MQWHKADDDARLLIAKRFILAFESGVIVIKHWKIHNYVRSDRFKETLYQEEKSMLMLDEKNAYTERDKHLGIPSDIPMVSKRDTQVRLGKDRLGKVNKDSKRVFGKYKNVRLTEAEYNKLVEDKLDYMIETLSEGKELKGYTYKSDYLAIRSWAKREKPKPKEKIKTKASYDIDEISRNADLNENYDI